MKQYILTVSLTVFYLFFGGTLNAQESNDTIKQNLIKLPFGQLSEKRLVGSVDVITGDELVRSGYYSLDNALVGLAPGLALGKVRGYSRGGDSDGPLVIVDGLSNRSLASVTIEEVESVQILKDVTAKMLYGSKAANGVVVVTTKRGANKPKEFSVTAEYGYRKAAEYPEFIGAAEYMKFRNQALLNDGKSALYDDSDINMAGSSYKYPDVDYYDMFAKDHTSFQNVNAQLVGGNETTQYFFNVGYIGEDGLEKVGDVSRYDDLSIRSNLDYEVNDVISVNLDIAGRFLLQNGNRLGTGAMFTQLSTSKPNDYPIFIGSGVNVDSLGTSDLNNQKNLYGDMVYSGYQRQETSFAQTNLGMDFDFNKYVKGLTAGFYGTFDVNNYISEGKDLSYRTLKPALTSSGADTLIVNGVYNPKEKEQRFGDAYYRNMGGAAHISYDNIFGRHALMANLSYMLESKSVKTNASEMSTIQDDKGMNFGLRLNYAYRDRYVAEMSSSYMGSTRFHEDNRWKLFNSFGVSYILSEEDFIKNLGFIDFLKLKASYGTIGYDQSFDYLLYNDYYQYWSGNFPVGIKNAESLVGTEFLQEGNKNLTFEESTELNVGIAMRVLDNKLAFSAEYYKEERTGMPTVMRFAYPQLAGSPDIVANYNGIDNQGYEISLQYSDKVGDFSYSVGGTLAHFVSEYSKVDEQNDYSFQNIQGTETDAIWGYVADGFYTTADEVANWGAENGVPLTSSLGVVIPGDLRYKNLSNTYDEYNMGDNVINYYDQTVIGNSRPRHVYTLNLNLKYKNFSLYAVGQGVEGNQRNTLWPSYYTNQANAKYSKYVYDAAVPVFDGSGAAIGLADADYSLPRLTTEPQAHSYRTSTFYLRNGAYFKLRTVELNYQLPERVASFISAQKLNVYVRGDNVLTISNEEDLDPESPASGLTGAPRFTTVSLGFKLVF